MATQRMIDFDDLRTRLGVELSNELAQLALTHRSFAYEHGGIPTNERLEFLGDSVLGIVVTDTLFRSHPGSAEGQLARMRAAVVNSKSLADVARTIDLGAFIQLGRGERATGGSDKSSILADTMEAIIGAVYLDHGLDAATELVHRFFDPVIASAAELGAGLDWKSSLQELTALHGLGAPKYVVAQAGPAHDRTFTAAVEIGDQSYGNGVGRSKKEAEHVAAAAAWKAIDAAHNPST
ncbi:MAG: ribonuclease III [Candidatus Nanopelagicales bacterium]